MANVFATSRCGCVLTTGKSKLRRAYCARSSLTNVELKDEVILPTTEWSSRSLFLNAEGKSKPSFNGETLVKRALLKKYRTDTLCCGVTMWSHLANTLSKLESRRTFRFSAGRPKFALAVLILAMLLRMKEL